MCDQSALRHLNHKSRRPVTCGFVSNVVSEGGLEPPCPVKGTSTSS